MASAVTPKTVDLWAGEVTATIDLDGGVLSKLVIDDLDVLVAGSDYGSFPMAPWCGRLAHGRLVVEGAEFDFPLNEGGHAIHGTARDGRWNVTHAEIDSVRIVHDLTAPWPFGGVVEQTFVLFPDRIELGMTIRSNGGRFPAQAGWHPWFKRFLTDDGPEGALVFEGDWQLERDEEFLPTGRTVPPSTGPWDDTFAMPDGVDVTVEWPGQFRLALRSSAPWVVVYDMEDEALCVEPQTGIPNGLNTDPEFVDPLHPLTVESTWSWDRPT